MKGTYNKTILIGRLGRDPETRYTSSGTAIASISIATNHKYKEEIQTDWHQITLFGKLAEVIAEYGEKGTLVLIEGRLANESWDDKDGNKRYSTKVYANSMQFLGGKGGNGGASDGDAENAKSTDAPEGGAAEEEDDLPF